MLDVKGNMAIGYDYAGIVNAPSNGLIVSGNVGIGITGPGFPLSFADSLGDKISLYGQSGSHYGFGIQGSLLQIYTDFSSSDIAFGYGRSGSFNETMRIKGNGSLEQAGSTASGSHSTALGLYTQATYDNAVAMGNSTEATGWNSVAMGWDTIASGSNSVAIGHNCNNDKDNSFAVCNANTDALIASGNQNSWLNASGGNVGIGTQSPGYKLDVIDRIRLRGSSSASTAGLWLADSNGTERGFIGLVTYGWPSTVGIYNNGAWRLSIDNGGDVGIGTTDPNYKLDVNGSINTNGDIIASSNSWGTQTGTPYAGWGDGVWNHCSEGSYVVGISIIDGGFAMDCRKL
jgi:hypothetical protein